jgi:hypothetical protein
VVKPTSKNRWPTARHAVEIFFPLRPVLKIDGHPFSPTLLHRIVLMGGTADSYEAAAQALQVVGELSISARTVNKLTAEIGDQLAIRRDQRVDRYLKQDLPRVAKTVDPPPALAAVFCDGGRMRTRAEGGGHGVHEPHWRETKNAAFHRMQSESYAADPQPDLPDCFCDQHYVEKLVLGLKKVKPPEPELASATVKEETSPPAEIQEEPAEWQPKTLVRTCISSLANSDAFGPQMAVEADSRGFYAALKRAFLGDGQGYNWTIQRDWFPTFTPIADFIHVLEYIYEAAQALHDDEPLRWQQYLQWATACWQGKVDRVIEEMQQASVSSETTEGKDREKTVQASATYLTNNRSRMDYPKYRCDGLPVTSSLAESLVKQISKRVKGTEKFWDDGLRGEAILQVRAAVISQDNRLATFLLQRPISPYSPRCHTPQLAIAA